MPLEQTLSRLMKGEFTGLLRRYVSSGFVAGRPVITYEEPIEVKFFTVPDGTNTLAVKDTEGSQIIDNRHFYFQGSSFNIKNRDLLRAEGQDYEIYGPEPRPHGNFTYAYGRAIDRDETVDSGTES
jgi:hypothetical protein